jgi:hypothetical protein
MGPPEHQRKALSPWAEEFGAEGNRGVTQAGRSLRQKQRKGALDVAEFIEAHVEGQEKLHSGCPSAGTTFAFRHYFTIDKVRLHGASLHEASALPSVRDQTGLQGAQSVLG